MAGTEEDGVKEATAALKGMLGIGGGALLSGGGNGKKEEEWSVATSAKKKKATTTTTKKKATKKNKTPKPPPSTNKTAATATATAVETATPPDDPPPTTKPKKPKKKKGGKKNEVKKESSSNFAWSAFQSSPDPSALPLPAFGSMTNNKPQERRQDESAGMTTSTPSPISVPESTPKQAGDGTEYGQMLKDNVTVKGLENDEIITASGTQQAQAKLKEQSLEDAPPFQPPVVKETEFFDDDAPTGGNGVNLAALASSPKLKPENPTQEQQSAIDSMTSPMNGSTRNGPGLAAPNHHMPFMPPQQHQQQQQHLQYPHPGGPMSHQHQPPMHMTIQVQVPPVLHPGRQMVVQTPAGYPMAVVVPEGVQPGMVIPVVVPVSMPPPHHRPPMIPMMQQQQHPSMMGPPPAVYGNPPPYPYPNMPPPHAHHHPQHPQHPQHHPPPHVPLAPPTGPKPGTWAAAAAGSTTPRPAA